MIPRDDPLAREERKVERPPARGIRPEKLVEGGTVLAHADQHNDGTDPVTPSGIGAAEENHGHAVTLDVFILPTQDAHDAILDDWAHNTAGAANEVAFIWHVPAEFTGFNTVSVVMIPDAEETIQADIDVSVATAGEAHNADTRQALNETKDIAAGDVDAITEWSLLDVGTLLGDIAIGDVIAIRFQSDTDTLRILGLRINYGTGSGGGVTAHGDLSGVTSDQHHAQAHGPSDHTSFANWKVIYTDGSGDQQELALGAAATFLRSAGASSNPTMSALVAGDLPAATTSAQGAVELATTAEIDAATPARAVMTDALGDSNYGERTIGLLVSDPGGDAITTGNNKVYARIPSTMNGWNLVEVGASLLVVSSSGIPTIQVRRSRRASATSRGFADMLSTKLTIDATHYDSGDATDAAVINSSNDDVNEGDHIYIDIDVAGTGAKGLFVTLTFRLP